MALTGVSGSAQHQELAFRRWVSELKLFSYLLAKTESSFFFFLYICRNNNSSLCWCILMSKSCTDNGVWMVPSLW